MIYAMQACIYVYVCVGYLTFIEILIFVSSCPWCKTEQLPFYVLGFVSCDRKLGHPYLCTKALQIDLQLHILRLHKLKTEFQNVVGFWSETPMKSLPHVAWAYCFSLKLFKPTNQPTNQLIQPLGATPRPNHRRPHRHLTVNQNQQLE